MALRVVRLEVQHANSAFPERRRKHDAHEHPQDPGRHGRRGPGRHRHRGHRVRRPPQGGALHGADPQQVEDNLTFGDFLGDAIDVADAGNGNGSGNHTEVDPHVDPDVQPDVDVDPHVEASPEDNAQDNSRDNSSESSDDDTSTDHDDSTHQQDGGPDDEEGDLLGGLL
jgi:hypothetical protein